jgi:hypothetical protein
MTLQVVLSPMIVIQMTLEVSFMLLENIYSTGITHDNCHLRSSYFYSTGQWKNTPHLLDKNHFAKEIRIRKAKAIMKLMENENFIIAFLKKSVTCITKILDCK